MAVPINELTESEKTFLASQNIGPDDVYDGRKMTNADWKCAAKAEGCDFVLAGRCTSGGHRLKTRAGHCIQCNTSRIAFMRRRNAKAFVYLATAQQGAIIKIGSTLSIPEREESLRKQCYGGYADWEIVSWFKTHSSGRIEWELSNNINQYRSYGHYYKDNKLQGAVEIFKLNIFEAFAYFKKFAIEIGFEPELHFHQKSD